MQILPSVCGLYFHSFSNAFHIAKALVFNELFYIYFSFVGQNLFVWKYFHFPLKFHRFIFSICVYGLLWINFSYDIWDLSWDCFFFLDMKFLKRIVFCCHVKIKWPYLCGSIGLAKKFTWVFPLYHTTKPENTFWPTQYFWTCYSVLLIYGSILLPYQSLGYWYRYLFDTEEVIFCTVLFKSGEEMRGWGWGSKVVIL